MPEKCNRFVVMAPPEKELENEVAADKAVHDRNVLYYEGQEGQQLQ